MRLEKYIQVPVTVLIYSDLSPTSPYQHNTLAQMPRSDMKVDGLIPVNPFQEF